MMAFGGKLKRSKGFVRGLIESGRIVRGSRIKLLAGSIELGCNEAGDGKELSFLVEGKGLLTIKMDG